MNNLQQTLERIVALAESGQIVLLEPRTITKVSAKLKKEILDAIGGVPATPVADTPPAATPAAETPVAETPVVATPPATPVVDQGAVPATPVQPVESVTPPHGLNAEMLLAEWSDIGQVLGDVVAGDLVSRTNAHFGLEKITAAPQHFYSSLYEIAFRAKRGEQVNIEGMPIPAAQADISQPPAETPAVTPVATPPATGVATPPATPGATPPVSTPPANPAATPPATPGATPPTTLPPHLQRPGV